MVMIARDEQEQVRDCLASFWPHVGEVVLCDTGSEDATVARARRFARERGEKDKLVIGHFDWSDDFSAARNHADSLASGRMLMFVDCDERIVGARHISKVCRELLAADGPVVGYGYCELPELPLGHPCAWKKAFATPGSTRWRWPTNEDRVGGAARVVDKRLLWKHTRPGGRDRRDLDICRAWVKREPDCARAWRALTLKYVHGGEPRLALKAGERYLRASTATDPTERLMVECQLAQCLYDIGSLEEASERVSEALAAGPPYAHGRLQLAVWRFEQGAYADALEQAEAALGMGSLPAYARLAPAAQRLARSVAAAARAKLRALPAPTPTVEVDGRTWAIAPRGSPELEAVRELEVRWLTSEDSPVEPMPAAVARRMLGRRDEVWLYGSAEDPAGYLVFARRRGDEETFYYPVGEEPSGWVGLRGWMRPELRRKGALAAAWPMWRAHYGAFGLASSGDDVWKWQFLAKIDGREWAPRTPRRAA
jgi:hypothetical protein